MLNDGITYWNAALNRRGPPLPTPTRSSRSGTRASCATSPPGSTGVPTLVVAPQSGLTGAALDTTMRTGLIATLLNNGHTNVYALEWVDPRGNARASGIDEHLAIIRESVDLAGGRANLIGYSQSGWAVTIIAALHPEKAVSLTLGAAPDRHPSLGRRALGDGGGWRSASSPRSPTASCPRFRGPGPAGSRCSASTPPRCCRSTATGPAVGADQRAHHGRRGTRDPGLAGHPAGSARPVHPVDPGAHVRQQRTDPQRAGDRR